MPVPRKTDHIGYSGSKLTKRTVKTKILFPFKKIYEKRSQWQSLSFCCYLGYIFERAIAQPIEVQFN